MNVTLVSILMGVGGMLGWGIYDFLGGVYSRQVGSVRALFWSQLAGLVSILALAVVLKTAPGIPTAALLLSILAGFVYTAGYLIFFRGLEKGNVSVIAAIMNLWAVFTMTFAFLFMGQKLTGVQGAGVALILLGALLASMDWNSVRGRGIKLSAGVWEAVLGAFFFGVFWNISEIVSEDIGWLPATILVKMGIVLFLLIFSVASRKGLKLADVSKKTGWILLLMGIIELAALTLVNYGLTIGDAILITPVASALSVVTITLAVIFLKEKVTRLQGFGMVMAVAGIVITAL